MFSSISCSPCWATRSAGISGCSPGRGSRSNGGPWRATALAAIESWRLPDPVHRLAQLRPFLGDADGGDRHHEHVCKNGSKRDECVQVRPFHSFLSLFTKDLLRRPCAAEYLSPEFLRQRRAIKRFSTGVRSGRRIRSTSLDAFRRSSLKHSCDLALCNYRS